MIVIIIIIISVILDYTCNNEAHGEYQAIQTEKKYKYLSDFPAVTLRAFC
jgi:hypothetical protein